MTGPRSAPLGRSPCGVAYPPAGWPALLLADPSPCLRWIVLRHLLGRTENDPEVLELASLREGDPLVRSLAATQEADGSWLPQRVGPLTYSVLSCWRGGAVHPAGGYAKRGQLTALALARLGYLGFGPEHPTVRLGAAYLFGRQNADGSWPLAEAEDEDDEHVGYSMIPLQTAFPLRGLAACGYATDPRAERAYVWLLAQRLPDGAWPTGIAAGDYGYVTGYRRLPHSRWGCRSNTTGALICLAMHPERRRAPETRRALDLLLGRETREGYCLGFEVARLLGAEPARGFISHFARFDLALLLDLCARAGASTDDARVNDLVGFVASLQSPYGMWEYASRPQMSDGSPVTCCARWP